MAKTKTQQQRPAGQGQRRTPARQPSRAKTEPEHLDVIPIPYDLHELPTAQHKAGLAGLLLQIDSMNERKRAGALPAEVQLPEVEQSAFQARILLSKTSLRNLLADLYDADEEKVPAGRFLERYTSDGNEVWHRLWRDMHFRLRPAQRGIFGPRAARSNAWETADRLWDKLNKNQAAKDRNAYVCEELIGALLPGGEKKSAETVPCQERADYALLLHFWQLAVGIFVPEWLDADGDGFDAGLVVVVPEVADLDRFCSRFKQSLAFLERARRAARKRPGGQYWDSARPRSAVITVAAEGALEFIGRVNDLIPTRVNLGKSQKPLVVHGADYFHIATSSDINPKKKRASQRGIPIVSRGRIAISLEQIRRHLGILRSYKNPLFRHARIVAALRDEPWFTEFEALFAERKWPFFIHSTQEKHSTPPTMFGFAWEANQRFQQIEKNYRLMKEAGMAEADGSPDSVDRLIYGLVGKYVKALACEKASVKEDDVEWRAKTIEERRDVCSKLFLELRSRNSDDFVRHFTATFGSVPQWLDEEKYLVVTSALMRAFADDAGEHRVRTRDDVKTLTLLALSAHSRSLRPKKESEDDLTSNQEDQE